MTTAGDINRPQPRIWLVALSISTALVTVACGTDEPPTPTDSTGTPAATGASTAPAADQPVTFEVTGSGPVDLMYRMYPEGEHDTAPVRCEGAVNAAEPQWSVQCDAADISSGIVRGTLVAQARGRHVEFECSIRLRETTVAKNKAKGRWVIAACAADEIYWWWK